MELRVVRTAGNAVIVATALLFGTAALAACGDDDGGEVRNLNEETAPPGATGSPSGSVSGSGSGSASGAASASEASASPTP